MKTSRIKYLIVGLVALAFLVVCASIWMQKQFDIAFASKKNRAQGAEISAPVVQPVLVKKVNRTKSIVTRKTWLDPGRVYEESVFYLEGQEIARFKAKYDDIYDFSGDIPDGKVTFVNDTQKTYGEEYYKNNLRDGQYKEYYEGDHIRREALYRKGQVITRREYFFDGVLRMEEDYSDAVKRIDFKEVGKGRIYFRDGSLMYEWSLTNSERGGYNKSYNIKGQLVETNYFDEKGQRIQKIRHSLSTG